MRYRLPFALAAVEGHARGHGSLGSPLTAVALQDCPNYERHEPLSAQLAARRWRPSGPLGTESASLKSGGAPRRFRGGALLGTVSRKIFVSDSELHNLFGSQQELNPCQKRGPAPCG